MGESGRVDGRWKGGRGTNEVSGSGSGSVAMCRVVLWTGSRTSNQEVIRGEGDGDRGESYPFIRISEGGEKGNHDVEVIDAKRIRDNVPPLDVVNPDCVDHKEENGSTPAPRFVRRQ